MDKKTHVIAKLFNKQLKLVNDIYFQNDLSFQRLFSVISIQSCCFSDNTGCKYT